jgi:hypothetical protein
MPKRILTILSLVAIFLAAISNPQVLGQDIPRLVLPRAAPSRTAQTHPREAQTRTNGQRFVRPNSSTSLDYRHAQESRVRQWSPSSPIQHDHSQLPAARGEVLADCEQCTHWIASVRHCQQRCACCANDCQIAFSKACSLREASPANEAEFRQWLRPGIPVCIMIHGSYFPAADVPSDCGQAVRWLQHGSPNVQYVCFTWPSEGIFTLQPGIAVSSLVPALDVAILGKRAELNGIRLAKFIQSLPASCPVSIVAHSHGARISSSALHLLAGGKIQNTSLRQLDRRRIRTVMVAAAIDHDWLNPNEKYGRAICATECMLNMKSQYDWALAFYPMRRLFSRTALGRTGFTRRDLMRQGRRINKLAEIEVADYVGAGHVFPHYYRHPSLATAIAPYVGFSD